MAFQGSNRRRFSESLSAASTPSQIIATLRSALPSGINALTASQASQIISNSRTTGLSEYANMLSIPSFTSGGRLLSNANPNTHVGHASVHPSFRSKSVCLLECKSCDQIICGRGMKAILLSDTRVKNTIYILLKRIRLNFLAQISCLQGISQSFSINE